MEIDTFLKFSEKNLIRTVGFDLTFTCKDLVLSHAKYWQLAEFYNPRVSSLTHCNVTCKA